VNLLAGFEISFQQNDERVHHYQRGRASITGLGLWSGKIIGNQRLVVVVTARLVLLLSRGDAQPETSDVPTQGHLNARFRLGNVNDPFVPTPVSL
jgi:hypothetical protein